MDAYLKLLKNNILYNLIKLKQLGRSGSFVGSDEGK